MLKSGPVAEDTVAEDTGITNSASPVCRDKLGNMLWAVSLLSSCSYAIVAAELQGSVPMHTLRGPGALDSRTTTCEVVATASNYPSGTGKCTSCCASWHEQPASFMFTAVLLPSC